MEPLPIGRTLTDAVRIYRLLLPRSVVTAAAVFGVIALTRVAHHVAAGALADAIIYCSLVLTLAGPVLVQGALIASVRSVHDGVRPESAGELLRRTPRRLPALLAAALLYGLGVFVGLAVLIVPGLFAAARWSLLCPAVMLEGLPPLRARARSSSLVKRRTESVLFCLVVGYLLTGWFYFVPSIFQLSFATGTLATLAWSALTAPFQAHLLTVLYYRLAEPTRPVILRSG